MIKRTHKITRSIILLAVALAFIPPCAAQNDDEKFSEALPPPDLPDPLKSGETIEPEVYIVRTDKEVIEEYRLNGHLYMVKITPKAGKPYYLIDENGDGQMEGKISDIYNTPRVPQWVLFSW